MTYQMSQYLGIGFRTERVTLTQQLVAQLLKILDHPIVDHCQLAALVKMRMRIVVGNFAVGSPPGMSDTCSAVRWVFLNQLR